MGYSKDTQHLQGYKKLLLFQQKEPFNKLKTNH